ncbi:MAG: FAD-binding oxidoreductase [Dehalococcoidia bacterium]|nr:FAD-binding oxidoreductase [Dehalococcoidia bacterium]
MVTQASVLQQLAAIAGPEHAGPPQAEEYAVDGLPPSAVVRPGSYEQAAEVLRYANSERLAVIPRGAGTLMALGNVPRAYDIALCLSRLDEIVEHEPADLTVTCQAGISLGRLREHLAAAGQMAPLDPTLPAQATAGGVLAANAYGPYRLAYGTARDFTIGMRVATADGRITRAGGRVVKNVAGYDLCKLYIGSLGTLGVILEATFKVRPRPREEGELAFALPGAADACGVAAEAERRGLSVAAAQVLNPAAAQALGLSAGAAIVLVLNLAGTPAAVARSAREIAALAAERGGRAATSPPQAGAQHPPEADPPPAGAGAPTGDSRAVVGWLSVLPSRVPEAMAAIEASAADARTSAYPTAGVLRVRCTTGDGGETLRRLREAAREAGGRLVIESCAPALKRDLDVFGDPPAAFELMRRVKQQFDPNGILSPGRYVGRL